VIYLRLFKFCLMPSHGVIPKKLITNYMLGGTESCVGAIK
jgi:hypothetical protein